MGENTGKSYNVFSIKSQDLGNSVMERLMTRKKEKSNGCQQTFLDDTQLANKHMEIWWSFILEEEEIKKFTATVISKRTRSELGLLAQAYNPATWETEAGELRFQACQGFKVNSRQAWVTQGDLALNQTVTN